MKRLFVVGAVILFLPFLALAITIPDTGQTKCYNDQPGPFADEIPCPNPGEDLYGQDAQYITNPQSYAKLDASGDSLPDDAPWPWAMVRDNVTGLVWEMKTDDGSIHDKDNTYTWDNAQSIFLATLNSQNFGGHIDWRLPTIKELMSIVNRDAYDPSINVSYYPNTLSSYYWSSTTEAVAQDYAWRVRFLNGQVLDALKEGNYNVRAVRGGQSSNNFIDNGDGTVTDISTGLMWEIKTDDGAPTWKYALYYSENLTLAGYNDWRLPNVNELHSIVDYSRYGPSIDPVFINPMSYPYWSSTTSAPYPHSAYFVHFRNSLVNDYAKSDYFFVRAVRGGLCVELGDYDGDTVCNNVDNCIDDYNPFQIDCDNDGIGDVCDPNTIDPDGDGVDVACDNCPKTPSENQADSYPPQGNGIGDACDCEGNFNCGTDSDVDGSDAALFKADFGRSSILEPCTNERSCNGDFNCDGDADGTDAALFKADFGRSSIQKPCPVCVSGEAWCSYQLP